MFILITKKVMKNITHSEYLASTNEIFVKLNIKLRDIVKHKSYLFAFKAFNGKLPAALNSLFIIKSGPYGMRSTNNFVRTIFRALNILVHFSQFIYI